MFERLKIPRQQWHAGSSPASGTILAVPLQAFAQSSGCDLPHLDLLSMLQGQTLGDQGETFMTLPLWCLFFSAVLIFMAKIPVAKAMAT